jgi:hypothetical protein
MPKDTIADPLVSATVRVRSPATGQTGKPGPEALRHVAKTLTDLGFHVLRVGRFGVSIEGHPGKFARILGVDVVRDRALVAPIKPNDPKLKGFVDLIEATPKPQIY